MAERYYIIKTFYRTDDVNEALINEKSGLFSLFNPIEKKDLIINLWLKNMILRQKVSLEWDH